MVNVNQIAGVCVQPGIAADRFAREIGGILKVFPARSRQLNANPLGASRFAGYLDLERCFLSFRHKNAVQYEETNQAWDKGPLCRVIPVNVCSTPRDASARCTECGSGQRLTEATWNECPWC
jgi:hypothetical protein